jgi:CRISPR-associated protein (TIGR03986 family)
MIKAILYVSRSKKGAVVLEIQPENAGKRTLSDSVFREDEKIKSLQPGEYEVEVELEENTKKIIELSLDGYIIKLPEAIPVQKYQTATGKKWSKTSNVPEEAYAPYNFISLDDKVIPYDKNNLPRRDVFSGLTGYINIDIESKTPLYIRRTLTEEEVEELTKIEKEENNKDKMREFNRKLYQSFSPASGKFKIPGSSLRGMVRNLYEIATYSKMSYLDEHKLYFRSFADKAITLRTYYAERVFETPNQWNSSLKVKAGFLKKEGKDYKITEAIKYYRVKEEDVLNANLVPHSMATYNNVKKRWEKNKDYDDFCKKHPFKHIWFKESPPSALDQEPVPLVEEVKEYDSASKDDYKEGYLVFSGWMPSKSKGKKKHWLIGAPTSLTHTIDETVVDDYCNDKNRSSINLIDFLNQNKKEYKDGVPCFFLYEDGKVTAFGNTALFRISYKNSIGDLRPASHKSDILDMAEALFGRVGTKSQDTINGRIYFDDAIAKEAFAFEEPIYPKILANPKPTSFQLYLKQPQNVTFNDMRHYDSPDAKLRGYKQYWHKKEGKFEEDSPDFDPQTDTQHTLIAPIKPGAKFEGSIRFENLSEEELGALLFVLQLPDECCHKIGMGKPLGLGSIRIETKLFILDPKQRYKIFLESGYAEEKDTAKYLDTYKKLLKNSDILKTDNLWEIKRFKELHKMLNFEQKPAEDKTEYMDIDKFKERRVLPEPLNV